MITLFLYSSMVLLQHVWCFFFEVPRIEELQDPSNSPRREVTGRARKLSAAERSRREFHAYTDTSPLKVSFSLLNICFTGRGVRGEGRASDCSMIQGVGGLTGRARKLSASERSRREFLGYTSPLEMSFSLLNLKCLFRC